MVVAPVDERDFDRGIPAELARRVQPRETAADYDDAVPAAARVAGPFRPNWMVCHVPIVAVNLTLVCSYPFGIAP